jgi:hypothetical protein
MRARMPALAGSELGYHPHGRTAHSFAVLRLLGGFGLLSFLPVSLDALGRFSVLGCFWTLGRPSFFLVVCCVLSLALLYRFALPFQLVLSFFPFWDSVCC